MKDLYGMIDSPVFPQNNFRKGSCVISGAALLILLFCIAFVASAATEYSVSDVDTPPKIVRQMPVTYPPQAKKDGITGRVIVRCLVTAGGKAEKLEIVESEPQGVFDDSALSSLKYWQFRPGIKNGDLVSTWVKVPFKFE